MPKRPLTSSSRLQRTTPERAAEAPDTIAYARAKQA
jgi:hypothetical protein